METLIEAAGKWGLGIVLSIVFAVSLLVMVRQILNRIWQGMNQERNNYMELIDKQNTTINNHISHLSGSIDGLSAKMGDVSVNLATQKECLDQGFTRVVEAIKVQTTILSKNNDKDN